MRAMGASATSTLISLGLQPDDAGAKKKRKRKKKRSKRKERKKRCRAPKGRCGKRCVPLNTLQNCGQCGNACVGEATCQDGVCCAQPLCRGECRSVCPPSTANRGFPQALDYGNGSITPNGGQDRLNADVEAAYERWKARYLVREGRDAQGNQVFRIALGRPGTTNFTQTVSEGQGYGMVILAIMAGYDEEAQEIVDGLWRFRLEHPSTIDPRLMDWKVPASSGDNSAFDGDADIAYGLLLADAQWGSAGSINYREAARNVIAGIMDSTIGPASMLPELGDWVDPNGAPYNQDTPRTSDFMPGHFRAFKQATGDGIWDSVIDACQAVITEIQTTHSPATGLLPDFAVKDATGFRPAPPRFIEGPHDGDYNYNAGRDPWRLGTDALLNGDETSRTQARKIGNWANDKTGGDPRALRAGYRLDGNTWPDTNYFTTFFAAPIGVAAMLTGDQAWLDAIYDAVRDVQEDYYEDTVTLLCLLVMTGNFWAPPA